MQTLRRLKKGLAILLTAAMAVGLMPGTGTLQAQAEESQAQETSTTTKTIAGLGTGVIADPTDPGNDTEKAWAGSYVYYGNYNGSPVKYRVLDASTTKFGGTTMLLDCDSILYAQMFDEDYTANEAGKNLNDWSISDVKKSLNGDDFLNKEGVFTTAEKNAIAESKVATHELTTDSETGVNVIDWTKEKFVKYVALTGEQIFILDAEDVSNRAYGYSLTDKSYFSCKNRKKTGSAYDCWWLRSADNSWPSMAGSVDNTGQISGSEANSDWEGVSPAFNVNLQSVLFSSVISGTAGETSAEYKLTLLDSDMTIAASGDVTRNGKTVTVPYSISGGSSANATQVSVLVLDKEYTAGNTNGATVLDYQKLNVDSFSTSGTGTYTLPDSLYRKGCGTDYHMYILAEDVNGEKETDYASTPVEITPTWKAPTVKQMNFGTKGIIDPAVPNSASEAWKGSYVYYGNYDADDNGTAEPVKYRVLDASTTDFSAGGTTQTMFLDCDSILYYTPFDNDGTANEAGKKANDWSISDVKSSLNGEGFLNKEGVFTTAEKNAIAASTVNTHTLTTDNVADWTQRTFVNYVALTGEQIFLLDAEDVSNGAYGYSKTDRSCGNRKKTGSSAAYWWLRSASSSSGRNAGYVRDNGNIYSNYVDSSDPGVSPALNLNLSSVIFSSANTSETSFAGKSSALTSGSTKIGTEANTDWKLTLKDDKKSVTFTEGRSVTKASDGTITVPYTYKDKENATEKEKVNQISVMITDKAYDAEKVANAQEAQILYYGALRDIKNAEGTSSTVAEASTGTGTFALPSSLTGTLGTDYHIYLLAEHVNADNSTDYASEPKEVTAILDEVDTVTVPSIDTPIAEEPLKEEITVSSTGVAEKATLTWKKNDTEETVNAQWKTTYQAYVTLKAADGYAFTDTTGAILNEVSVDTKNITMNEDGTLTIACGEYTTATRKTESAAAPEVPTQFANYYTADNVLSSTEFGTTAKVTLEGKTQPNPEEMEVEWAIVDEEGNATTYDATPTATNTFKWTVKASQYADYDKDTAVLEGTVTIQNKDYTSVTITGSDVTVTYGGTLDVSQYFTIDENAGTPTYELSDASTGAGTLTGTTLTMTTLGTFVVKVSTPINGVYNKGEHTLTITVNKAAPNVTALPTVADRIYHPSTVLADTDITDGTVKDVSGNSLAGTWRWKEADVVPTVDNDGYVAVFTPEDTVHYQSVEKTISVNVSKATPYIKTVPTATAITYGEALSASTLKDAVVWYSESDEKAVKGTFTWKDAATKPTVADSDKTEYDVVFTPTDAENYNTVETKITLTVNKAASAPGLPNNTMEVDYDKKKVSDVTLPEGWAWQDEDKDKALTVGTAVAATAVYTSADKGNYETESVEISITRLECTHATKEVKNAKDATCTEKGYTGDTCCTVCGKVITAGTDINALGHDMTKTISEKVEATCTTDGKEAVKGCSRCDYTEGGEKINALGHDFAAEFTVDKEATCAETGSQSKHCSRCDEVTEVTPIDKLTTHNYVNGVCSVCDDIFKTTVDGVTYQVMTETGADGKPVGKLVTVSGNEIPQVAVAVIGTGDDLAVSDGKVTVPSEITGSGSEQTFVVTKIAEDAFAGESSNAVTEIVVPATVTEVGTGAFGTASTITFKGNTAPSGIAGAITETVTTVNVPEGAADSYREELNENANIVEPHTHTFDTKWTYDETYHWHVATCGHAEEVSDKAVHTFGEWTVTKEATEDAEGVKERSCSCGCKENAKIDKLAHTIHVKDEGTRVEPTCEKKGSITYKCTKCGEVMEVVELDATGHKWDGGKVTKEPTETAEGVKTYTCSVCGKTKTEAIPKKSGGGSGEPDTPQKPDTQEPPKKGDVVADDKASVTVEVTDVAKKEVEYKEPTDKKAKTVSIPATVKIDGVTYKVTKVDDNAFKNNKTVTKVTVGSNIKTIGKSAFSGATKLKTVKIGKNVTKIGANAFSGCKKLKTIKITSTKLSSKTVSKNAFKGLTKATTIKVPKKKLSAYKKLFKQKGLSSKVKVIGY